MFTMLAIAAMLFPMQATPTVPPGNIAVTFTCSSSPPLVGGNYELDDTDGSYSYTATYADGSYLIVTGPTPSLALNRRGGNINTGSIDFVGGQCGFMLTASSANMLQYTCDALPSRDGWGAGPLTITVNWP